MSYNTFEKEGFEYVGVSSPTDNCTRLNKRIIFQHFRGKTLVCEYIMDLFRLRLVALFPMLFFSPQKSFICELRKRDVKISAIVNGLTVHKWAQTTISRSNISVDTPCLIRMTKCIKK